MNVPTIGGARGIFEIRNVILATTVNPTAAVVVVVSFENQTVPRRSGVQHGQSSSCCPPTMRHPRSNPGLLLPSTDREVGDEQAPSNRPRPAPIYRE
jgi:hypothetical protein